MARGGRKGRVLTSGPSGGLWARLDSGKIASAGDWLAVKKDFPGIQRRDVAHTHWRRALEAERKDLSPATSGRQALRI